MKVNEIKIGDTLYLYNLPYTVVEIVEYSLEFLSEPYYSFTLNNEEYGKVDAYLEDSESGDRFYEKFMEQTVYFSKEILLSDLQSELQTLTNTINKLKSL